MVFQSYLFSKNLRKLAIDLGPCLKIYISNISNDIISDRKKLCKFLTENNINFNTYPTDIPEDIKKIFTQKSNDIIEIINDKNIKSTKNELLELKSEITDISNIDTNNKIEICSFFYTNRGIKAIFNNQIVKLIENIHSDIRLKSLFIDRLLLFSTSYVRSLKSINKIPNEILIKNINKISKLSNLIRSLDKLFEIESKKIHSSFNISSAMSDNIHVSGFKYTSDIYSNNKDTILDNIRNIYYMFALIILLFIMFIISTIMSCFKLIKLQNNILDCKLIQTSNKIKDLLSNMS